MSELPIGWATLRLGDVVTPTTAVDPSKSPDELFELYSVPSFADGLPETTSGTVIKSSKQAVQSDDVLLCKIVPHLNRVWVVGRKTDKRQIASGEWLVYRNHGCEPDYLRYCLSERSFRDRFMQTVAGVGGSLMRARPSEVAEIEVGIAPRPEQRRIVAKIDALCVKSARARGHLDHLPRLVEKYKQAVLSAAFKGDLTRDWRKSQRRAMAWQETTLGAALVDIRYGTAKKCSYEGGAVPVLRIPNVQRGCVTLDDLKHADFTSAELRKLRLDVGDILIIRSNGSLDLVGQSAVVDCAAAGMLFAGYLIRLRLDHSLVDPDFVQLHLRSAETRLRLETLAKSTSGVNNINSGQLQSLPLLHPDLDEQREMVRLVQSAFKWIDHLAAEATSARKLVDHLDQAVLSKAFRGELVPQDPNDEPASVLLERIKAERATPQGRPGGRGRRPRGAA